MRRDRLSAWVAVMLLALGGCAIPGQPAPGPRQPASRTAAPVQHGGEIQLPTEESGEPAPEGYARPDEDVRAHEDVRVESVQVSRDRVVFAGHGTLPEGDCLQTQLFGDGAPQAWWPAGECVPVQDDGWQVEVMLGEGGVPETLDPRAQYELRLWRRDDPSVESSFWFDVAGPPDPEAGLESALAARLLDDPKALCEWEVWGRAQQTLYVWALCESAGGTATSVPAVVHLGAEGHVEGVDIPRDGSYYGQDLRSLFPPKVQARILAHEFDTHAALARISERRAAIDPAHTSAPSAAWVAYTSEAYRVSLEHPAGWGAIPGYEERRGGPDGFVQLSAMSDAGLSLREACGLEAEHKLQPYGSEPQVDFLEVQGQEACRILPSDDQPADMEYQAALIVRYPTPVQIASDIYHYVVLWADLGHIDQIGQGLRLLAVAEPTPPPHGDSLAYQRVAIAEAGLEFEVPAGWPQLEGQWAWAPPNATTPCLGIEWADLQPPMEPESILPPGQSQILSSEPVDLGWASGRRITIEVYTPAEVSQGSEALPAIVAVETHVVVVASHRGDRRAYDFYARGRTAEELAGREPLLQHMLDSAVVGG